MGKGHEFMMEGLESPPDAKVADCLQQPDRVVRAQLPWGAGRPSRRSAQTSHVQNQGGGGGSGTWIRLRGSASDGNDVDGVRQAFRGRTLEGPLTNEC